MIWPKRPLEEVCDLITDGTHHSPENTTTGRFMYVTAKNIRPWGLDISDMTYVDKQTFDEIYARCPVQKNDVLYIKDGVTTGIAVLNNLEQPFAMLSSVALLRPKNEVLHPDFLKHWLNSPETLADMTQNMTGTAIKRLILRHIRSTSAPIPPLPEQRRIVAKLESLQARSRRAREALEAVPPLLEKLRQSILAAAFRGDLTADWREQHPDVEPASELLKRIRTERRKKWEQAELAKLKAKGKKPTDDKWKLKYVEPEPVDESELPELPAGWGWASVEELSVLITSGSRGWAEFYADDGPLFVRSQDISSDSLSLVDIAHVKVPENSEGGRTRVSKSDILITITGANVTRCAQVDVELGESYVSQHVALVRPVLSTLTALLHLWLVCESGGRKVLKSAAYGLGKPGLNLQDVANVPVPLPPTAEQHELIAATASRMATLSQNQGGHQSMVTSIQHLDSAILSKAFRGELVPQDPNDANAPRSDTP